MVSAGLLNFMGLHNINWKRVGRMGMLAKKENTIHAWCITLFWEIPFLLVSPPLGLACLLLSSEMSEEKAWVEGGSEELLWFHRELGPVSEDGQSGEEPNVES